MRQWKRDGVFLDVVPGLPATMYAGDFPQDVSALIAGPRPHVRPLATESNRKKIAQILIYWSTYATD